MKKNVVKDIEAELTELVESDINNPKIYEDLKTLAQIFIYQNKYNYGYSDVQAVCHDVAADTYMRLLRKRTTITSWMSYIAKSIKLSYVIKQRKIEHENIDTTDNPTLKESVIDMCAGSTKSFEADFDGVYRKSYLENIDCLIRQTLNKSKFKRGTKEWLCLYMNMSLSLCNDKITYFRIPNELKPHLRLLLNRFRIEFAKSPFTDSLVRDDNKELPTVSFYSDQQLKEYSDKRKG